MSQTLGLFEWAISLGISPWSLWPFEGHRPDGTDGVILVPPLVTGSTRNARGMGTTMGELLVLPIYANLPTDMQVPPQGDDWES